MTPEERGTAGGSNSGTQGEEPEHVRYSVPQAARVLGISERGVRQRIKAGTLAAEREGPRWIVLLLPEERGTASGSVPEEAVLPAEERGSIPPPTASVDSVPADLFREQQARLDRLQHEKEQAMQQAAYFQGQLEELREHVRLLTDAQHEASVDTETETPKPWWRRIFG